MGPKPVFLTCRWSFSTYVLDSWNMLKIVKFTSADTLTPQTTARSLGKDAAPRWPEITILWCDCKDWSSLCRTHSETEDVDMQEVELLEGKYTKRWVPHGDDQSGTEFLRHKDSSSSFCTNETQLSLTLTSRQHCVKGHIHTAQRKRKANKDMRKLGATGRIWEVSLAQRIGMIPIIKIFRVVRMMRN